MSFEPRPRTRNGQTTRARARVSCRDGPQRSTDGLDERLAGASGGLPQQRLDLREGLLDDGVLSCPASRWRQERQRAAPPRRHRLAYYPFALARAAVVVQDHYYLSGPRRDGGAKTCST